MTPTTNSKGLKISALAEAITKFIFAFIGWCNGYHLRQGIIIIGRRGK
jgi:hypothetical protein